MDNLKTCINSKPLTLNETDKSYNSIDLVKFIWSLLIIVIHSQPLLEFSDAANYIFNSSVCRLAVPFFFIVSGFFFANGLEKTNNKQKYFLFYEKKLIILYLFWQIINLPLNILIYVEKYPHAGVIKYVFLLCRTIFLCGNGVTWYILAMAEAAVVLYLINKFRLN